MKIKEIEKEMTESIAYVVGMMYPLLKVGEIEGVRYVVGCVNHNKAYIENDEIIKHYQSVDSFMNKYDETKKIKIRPNKVTGKYTISIKEGFSILLDIDQLSEEDVLKIFERCLVKIKNSSDDEIKKKFVCGCFDGRSSFDKTACYLSIDVDRDHARQNMIKDVIESLNIKVNLNQRDLSHKKNDQVRIKKESIRLFMNKVGLFSARRDAILKDYLG